MRALYVVLLLLKTLACSGGEVVLAVDAATSAPTVKAQVLLGNFPLAATFIAPNALVPINISGGCHFDGDSIKGKTALVLNPGACDGKGGALKKLVELQIGTVSAVLASPDESGDVGEPNFALLPASQVPNAFSHRDGMVFSAPRSWVLNLASKPASVLSAAQLSAQMFMDTILVGTEVRGTVLTGHITYYKVNLGSTGDMTVTVTPTFGNPDLYMSAQQGPQVLSTPTPLQYQAKQDSPGDDAFNWRREDLPAGEVYAVIGIYGAEHSDYTLLVSSSEDAVTLFSGQPKRFEVREGEIRYFQFTVARMANLDIIVTPLTGDPDLYVSLNNKKPNFDDHQWSSVGVTQRYEHVEIAGDDPARPNNIPELQFYMAVVANSATTFSIVAKAHAPGAKTDIQLIDGIPQAGMTTELDNSQGYVVHPAGSHTDITMSLVMHFGVAHIYVNNGRFIWNSLPVSEGDERLQIPHTDPGFCVLCDYHITVRSEGPASYTITSTSSGGFVVLEDGSPVNEVVTKGNYEYFKLFVSRNTDDVQLIMTAFAGNPDLFASTITQRPDVNNHEFSSEDTAGDIISIDHDDPRLKLCTSGITTCVIYVAVYGKDNDASFSLTATATSIVSGFHVDSPTAIAGDVGFTRATFGAPLPEAPLSANIVYAKPHHACQPLTNADEVSGKIVMIDRGPSSDSECPFPHRYFANKVKTAQDANAIAVIMVNDRDSGLVYMGSVSGDHATNVHIPSIFITKANGDILKQHLGSTLIASLSRPHNRFPFLVPGVPMNGISKMNEFVYYQIITSPGHDGLSITVASQFGDPDLYVSAHELPNQHYFTWSSRSSGSETLTIPASDPELCRSCIIYVGVLAAHSNSHFTITSAVAETLVTLQAGVPLPAQEVTFGAYRFYRFFVDRSNAGFTIGVTLQTGDADIFVAFDEERPTREHHTWSATGRTTCGSVDCGNSIMHGDAIHIPSGEAACPRWPCLAYIGVYGAANTTFTLLMTEEDNERRDVTLLEGVETRQFLPHAGSYAYFKYFASSTVTSFDISVTRLSGDPDLYVGTGAKWPDRNTWQWRSTSDGNDEVHISTTSDPLSCADAHDTSIDGDGGDDASSATGCLYKIAVYAWSPNVEFLISVTSQRGELLMSDGQPVSTKVGAGESRFFRYPVRSMRDIEVVVTPFSGNPSLYARFMARPRISNADAPQWASTESVGLEALVLSHTDPHFCDGAPLDGSNACTLYLLVHGVTNSSFSLVVTASGEQRTSLVPNQPQAGVIAAHKSKQYSFFSSDLKDGLSFALTSYSGNPLLCLLVDPNAIACLPRCGQCLPSSLPIRIPPQTAPQSSSVPFYLAVMGMDHPSSYSLVVRSSIQRLQDCEQFQARLHQGEVAYFSVRVPDGANQPVLYLSGLMGSVNVEVSTFSSPNWLGTIGPEDQATVPLLPGVNTIKAVVLNPRRSSPPPPPSGSDPSCIPSGMIDLLASGKESCERVPTSSCEQYYRPRPDIGGWQPCGISRGDDRCAPGAAVQCGATPTELTQFSMLPTVSSTCVPRLIEGEPLLLEVVGGHEQHFVLMIHQQRIAITAAPLIGSKPAAITVTAILDGRSSSIIRNEAAPGAVAQLSLPSDWLATRPDNVRPVRIGVSASRAANISLIASSQIGVTRLPISSPSCVDSLSQNEARQFAFLLHPDDEADDELELELNQCAGQAEVYVSEDPDPSPSSFHFKSTGPRHPPLHLPKSMLAGKRAVYASVSPSQSSSTHSSSFCISVRPASQPAREVSVSDQLGQLRRASETAASLDLTLKMLVPLHNASEQYTVYFAPPREGGVFYTWCGVQRSSRQLALSSAHPSGDDTLRLTARLPPLGLPSKCNTARSDCFAFDLGAKYWVTVVATEWHGVRRHVYEPFVWSPGQTQNGGGANGFVVFLLFVLFMGIGIGVGLVIARRRGIEPSDMADYIRNGADKVGARVKELRLSDRAREVRDRARELMRRQPLRPRGTAQPSRVRVGDGMRAPLTSDTDFGAPLTCSHIPISSRAVNGNDGGYNSNGFDESTQPLQFAQVPHPPSNGNATRTMESSSQLTGTATGDSQLTTSFTKPGQSHEDDSDDVNLLPLAVAAPVAAAADQRELPLSKASVMKNYDMDE